VTKLNWVPKGITVILSYLLASASAGKLLVFDKVFDKVFQTAVFDNLLVICLILFILYIIIEFTIYFRNNDKKLKTQCNNICRYVYKYIEKHMGENFVHACRITIFKAMRQNTEKVYLEAISRYQIKEPYKKARITFRPGEGAVGKCFEIQALILACLPDYNKDYARYCEESNNVYKLDEQKVEKLNVKSCLFLCIPIKYFDTEKTWGVLVLDSTIKDTRLDEEFARGVEEIIGHYTVFFTEGEKQ